MDLLRDQAWVASVRQLEGLGISSSAISKARCSGLVDSVAPGVVGLHGVWSAFEGRAWAALLVGDDGAFLSGPTAARLYGLRGMPVTPIELTLPEVRHRHVPAWIRLVKSSWPDEEPRPPRTDGLVVASPLRMLFGLAGRFNQHRFDRAAEDAWHLRLVEPVAAESYLERIRRRGLTGVSRFETWLESTRERSRAVQSGLEHLALDLVRSIGLPDPERQFPLRLRSGEVVHLDIAWPRVRLALEPGHSWWHGGDLGMRADQDRDRACSEVGWHVVRYDESLRERRRAIGVELAEIYRQRAELVLGAARRPPAS